VLRLLAWLLRLLTRISLRRLVPLHAAKVQEVRAA
jgi:hypothetical protein